MVWGKDGVDGEEDPSSNIPWGVAATVSEIPVELTRRLRGAVPNNRPVWKAGQLGICAAPKLSNSIPPPSPAVQ